MAVSLKSPHENLNRNNGERNRKKNGRTLQTNLRGKEEEKKEKCVKNTFYEAISNAELITM